MNAIAENWWEFPPKRRFEWLNKDDSWFENIKISGHEFEDYKRKEVSILKRITPKWTIIPEIFLYIEFTFIKAHTEKLQYKFSKYLWKFVEVMYIDWHTSRWVLQITEPNPWFDDITKLWNQIVVEGLSDRDYISYDRIMKEGIYIRIIDGLDINWLKESVSWKVSDVFKIDLH